MGSIADKPSKSDDGTHTANDHDHLYCSDTSYSAITRALSSLDPETLDPNVLLAFQNITKLELDHVPIRSTIDPSSPDNDDILDAVAIAVDVMSSSPPTLDNPHSAACSASSSSTATCYRRRSSNLLRVSDGDSWDTRDIAEVAFEMRCQMRLLRSLKPLHSDSYQSSYESDEVNDIVLENARLTKQFRLAQNENINLTKIIKEQRRQIEELQRAIQQQTD